MPSQTLYVPPQVIALEQAVPRLPGAIAVFDSGLGGLSVLRSLQAELPEERFVFVADQAHVPYGDKPQSYVIERSKHIAGWAYSGGAKALVIACNTATAAAAVALRTEWPEWPIIGIEPAVKPAAFKTRSGVVGILATTNTLASEKFQQLVARFEHQAQVVLQPCPGLVECIEAGHTQGEALHAVLAPYVRALVEKGADVIVLGCTHYPLVMDSIAQLAGPDVLLLETGQAVARETRRRLQAVGALAGLDAKGSAVAVTTGDRHAFEGAVGLCLPVRG